MNTEEVAQKVVELVRKQAWHEALDTLYDKNIVSTEARASEGESPEKRGIDQVRGKTDWWLENMQVHSFKANGPFVAHDRFVVQYDADVTDKNSNKRMQLSEVGVYTVKDAQDRARRISAADKRGVDVCVEIQQTKRKTHQ